MPAAVADRIVFGAAAIPEPDRAWLAAAERLPIESIWHGGHILPRGPRGETITRVALLAAWTERVRIGTAVLVLPLYHPVLVAKQLADLDAHSGGRLAVGIGVGGEFPEEFEAVGSPITERGQRTDEAIEVMRALWTGEPVTHHGRYFQLDDVQLHRVQPLGADETATRPRQLPVVISGRKPAAMRRAARAGDGWMPYLVSPRAYAESVRVVREEATRRGRDLAGFEWMLTVKCAIRKDGDQARDEIGRFLGYAYRTPDKVAKAERVAPAGTPAEVAARLQAFVDAGARTFIISPAVFEGSLDVIELAVREVWPRLRLPDPGQS
jgi:probable F420-dependent oxidoreductase